MKKTALVLIPALLLPVLLLGLCAFLPGRVYGESYYGGMEAKLSRIRQAGEGKIVIVGGSAAAFGADSSAIGQELGREVVNFGLYAALGTVYMMEQAKPYIEKGDILLLIPELSEQTMSAYFGADYAWQVADCCPSTLLHIPPNRIGEMIAACPAYLSSKFRLKRLGGARADGVYARSSFSEAGDLVYPRPWNSMLYGYDRTMPIRFDVGLIDPEFTEAVNAFTAYAESKGARVCYGFPPMNALALASSPDEIYAFFLALTDSLDCPVISSPEDCVLDAKLFYDSNFHVNDAGAAVYSAMLANDLLRTCGIPRAVPIPDTAMIPDVDPGTDPDAVSSGAEGFLTAAVPGGVSIVGVAESLADAETIVIPDEIGGRAVAAIETGAFSACRKLLRITIPAGVVSLADGIFDGCAALREIRLNAVSASDVSVGGDLLRGCGAMLYVSEDAYPSFVSDYFWSRYTDVTDILGEP